MIGLPKKTEKDDTTGRFNRGDNITTDRGTSATYTLRRLTRDRPELAERVIKGELSANAAAIEGLGCTVAQLKALCHDSDEATELLREALKGRTYNVSTKSRATEHGNRRDAALDRLSRERPDLRARVANKELTAHAAMIEAVAVSLDKVDHEAPLMLP